jgi:hypothetical protein
MIYRADPKRRLDRTQPPEHGFTATHDRYCDNRNGGNRQAQGVQTMTTGSAAMIEAPFEIDLGVVPAAWIDANGHMNVLHYLEASEQATAAFYEVLGIGVAYRTQNHCGMFAAEHHIV